MTSCSADWRGLSPTRSGEPKGADTMRRSLLPTSLVIATPLVLGTLEVGHPGLVPGDEIVTTIVPIVTWWTVLHILQVPLFALLGASVFLLVRDLDGRAADVARYAAVVFAVVYPAFDA